MTGNDVLNELNAGGRVQCTAAARQKHDGEQFDMKGDRVPNFSDKTAGARDERTKDLDGRRTKVERSK